MLEKGTRVFPIAKLNRSKDQQSYAEESWHNKWRGEDTAPYLCWIGTRWRGEEPKRGLPFAPYVFWSGTRSRAGRAQCRHCATRPSPVRYSPDRRYKQADAGQIHVSIRPCLLAHLYQPNDRNKHPQKPKPSDEQKRGLFGVAKHSHRNDQQQ